MKTLENENNHGKIMGAYLEAPWPSGRASDSGARGRGFNPHSVRRVVSLSKLHLPPKKVLEIPRKRWLRPDMTEKLLPRT